MTSKTVISALAARPVGARCNIWVSLNRGLIIPFLVVIIWYYYYYIIIIIIIVVIIIIVIIIINFFHICSSCDPEKSQLDQQTTNDCYTKTRKVKKDYRNCCWKEKKKEKGSRRRS